MNTDLLNYFNDDALAASVWQGKYAQKDEQTPDDMHRRLARRFASFKEQKSNNPNLSNYGKARDPLTEEKIYSLFKDFKYVVPQGSVMSVIGSEKVASASNCFVVGQPYDSYSGIMKKDEELAQLMKRRGGVGIDISTLRPSNTPVTNAAGTSTGAVSFMERFSNTTREVAQNGRRGALMISIDVRHPDVMDFVTIKQDPTKVTGANVSVQIRDDFMKAVKSDSHYYLRWPCDAKAIEKVSHDFNVLYKHEDDNGNEVYMKKIKARELWNEIIRCAHASAEPGLMFLDKHWDYSPDTVYPLYKGVTTNPSLRHDTLIQTDLGAFTIKELAEKDGLTIVKNIKNEWQAGKVFLSGKNKDLYKITFTNGYSVYCTAEHKWPILNTEKKLFNLSTGEVLKKRTDELTLGGDKIPVLFRPNFEGNVSCQLTNDDGFISGYYLGHGEKSECSDGNWQYGFVVSEKELNCCGTRLNSIISNKKVKNTISNFNQDHESKEHSIYVSEQGFVDYCDSLSLLKDKSLGVPKIIWSSGSEYIKGFIDGLFSSDGSVWDNKDLKNSKITLVSSSHQIVIDVQKILNFFGIISNIEYQKTEDEFEHWSLVISGIQARKFAQCFTLTSNYKQVKLQNILNFENTYEDNEEYLVIKNVENTHIKEDVYDITVYDETHTFQGEFGVTGNCGEIFMQEYDACRLLAINLFSFVQNPFTPEARFDYELFFKYSYEMQILADILVELELEQIDKIINKIKSDPEPEDVKAVELALWTKIKQTAANSRRTGSGFTALGDMLAALNLKYDGDDSLNVIDKVMRTKFEGELNASIDMAITQSPFTGWDASLEYELDGEKIVKGKNEFYEQLYLEFPELAQKMVKFGRRNVNWSTVAPTGSVSILTQTTSGLEPIFMVMYKRRKKINPSDENSRVDFIDQNGDKWQEYAVLHPKFIDWYFKYCENSLIPFDDLKQCKNYLENSLTVNEIEKLVEMSPWNGSTANDIDWVGRVKIQGIIQKYITHSISSTINLPNNVSTEEVSTIYLKSWENNLKGVTVYRDGCRSGVLISNETPSTSNKFDYKDAIKRPQQLPCTIDTVTIQKQKFTVLVGLLDGKPYEVFVIPSTIMKDYNSGFISKKGKGVYTLTCSMDQEISILKDLTASMTDEQETITRLVSTSLRHGANVKFICEQLLKTKGELNSFSKAIARVLKKHIPDGEVSTMTCENCGSHNLVFEEGCQKCYSCGNSKCS